MYIAQLHLVNYGHICMKIECFLSSFYSYFMSFMPLCISGVVFSDLHYLVILHASVHCQQWHQRYAIKFFPLGSSKGLCKCSLKVMVDKAWYDMATQPVRCDQFPIINMDTKINTTGSNVGFTLSRYNYFITVTVFILSSGSAAEKCWRHFIRCRWITGYGNGYIPSNNAHTNF